MKYRTLTRAAGKHCFDAEQEIELTDEDATELLAVRAIVSIDAPKPVVLESRTSGKKSNKAEAKE